MKGWLGLLRKEFLELSRDPRGLMASMGLAIVAPLVIYGGMSYAVNQATDTPPTYVDMVEGDAAPNLLRALAADHIFPLDDAPVDDRERWQKLDIRLVIPTDFRELISTGETVELMLTGNLREDPTSSVVRRINRSIAAFSGEVGQRRLILRGIDARIVNPLQVQIHDTAPPENNLGKASQMLVIYVIMAAFFSALATAIDTSAGERERNMLELLLSQPVRSIEIVTAKLAGVVAVSMGGVALTLLLSAVAMNMVDLTKAGLSFSLSVAGSIAVLLAILPVSIFAGALILLVAFFAKSFKEAQSQVTMVIMVPAMAPMLLMFTSSAPELVNRLPIAGQFIFIEQIIKGESPALLDIALASAGTLGLAAVFILVASYHLRSERSVNAL